MVDTGGGALRCRPFFSQRAAPPSPSITNSFEVPKTNFMPQRDLSILILKPLPR